LNAALAEVFANDDEFDAMQDDPIALVLDVAASRAGPFDCNLL
jgi:hypothetical protein